MERYYQPEIETASREQLLAWQNERLLKQVRHVWDNVPYYRQKMEEKGTLSHTWRTCFNRRSFCQARSCSRLAVSISG